MSHLLRAVLPVILAASAWPVAAEAPASQTVFERYAAALNRGDARSLRALLADDFESPVRWRQCGRDQSDADCEVRMRVHSLIDAAGRYDVTDMRVQLDILRANVTVTSDHIRGAGVDRVLITEELVVDNGLIVSRIMTFRTEDPQTSAFRAHSGLSMNGPLAK